MQGPGKPRKGGVPHSVDQSDLVLSTEILNYCNKIPSLRLLGELPLANSMRYAFLTVSTLLGLFERELREPPPPIPTVPMWRHPNFSLTRLRATPASRLCLFSTDSRSQWVATKYVKGASCLSYMQYLYQHQKPAFPTTQHKSQFGEPF